MTGELRVSVLGPVRTWRDNVELNLGRPLQRAVLGVLAMNAEHMVPRGELIEAVWGDDVPPSVEGSLYTYISALRRLVGSDAAGVPRIRSERSSYLLRLEPGCLDAAAVQWTYERATLLRIDGRLGEAVHLMDDALSHWHGVPFTDVPGPFASAQRDRLTALREMLVEERAELMLRSGRAHETIAELFAEVQSHPLRERLRALLMVALYHSGRQSDALDQYRKGAVKLADELGVDPSPALQQLYRRIRRGDPPSEVTAGPTPAQHVPGRHTPKQLPCEHGGFVGRGRELAELHALLPAPGDVHAPRPLAVIDGAGGIGKTALAVRFAHEVAGQFPGGQLFVQLHGFDPEQSPLTASAALSRVLRDLGVAPASIPTALDEQAALYRSTLANRDMLIVLDDALSAEQVRPLLPGGQGCLVLVTSRSRLSGLTIREGARRVALDVLSEAESASMLGACQADNKSATELARLYGGLPLALRIAVL